MERTNPDPSRRWVIECSEEQLQLIRDALSDIHLFLRGNASMQNTILATPHHGLYLRPELRRLRRFIAPELSKQFPMPDRYDEDVIYSWSGQDCPLPRQAKKIALSHAIHSAITYNINRFLTPDSDPAFNPRPKRSLLSGDIIRCIPGCIINKTPNKVLS